MTVHTQSGFSRARAETIAYHEQYYGKHRLFDTGSWLEKPDPKIAELLPRFADMPSCRVLDLGAGVGRNSIPVARALPADARVTCVELLPSATNLLREYAEQHGVANKISIINADFETVELPEEEFHLVLGISTLEHCSSYGNLVAFVQRFQKWTRAGGVHYLNFSTNRTVNDYVTGEPVETLVETRLQTQAWLAELSKLYSGWKIELLRNMEPYSEALMYNGKKVIWSSDEMEILAVK